MAVKYAQEEVSQAELLASETTNDGKKLVNTITKWMDDADGERSTWKSDQSKWYKLRMRVKKVKDYPFPNCSNIRLPTLDNKIKKLKASAVNALLGIRPIVQAIPDPSGNWQTAAKIEKFLDHLSMDVMEIYNDVIIDIDQTYEKGFYLNKVYWRLEIIDRTYDYAVDDLTLQETVQLYNLEEEDAIQFLAEKFSVDRNKYVWSDNYEALKTAVKKIFNGAYAETFSVKDVTYSFPDIAYISPDECYVPTDAGYSPKTLPYFIHEYYVTIEEAEANVVSLSWDIAGVEFIKSLKDLNEELQVVKDNKEGITRYKNTGKVRVCECFGYIEGKRQCVTIFPDFKKLVKTSSMPTPSGKIPVVKFFHELREDRWYHHRSLCDILEDLVKEIDVQHMQKIDRQTLVNSPTYIYRAGMVNTSTTQFMFGQGIPAQGMQPLSDIIAPLNQYNQMAELSYDREQQILKADIDEYTGQIDYTLAQQINRREPRTAEEVSTQANMAALISSLDNNIFRQSLTELLNLIWEMWCEYGDDEYEFLYFGANQYEKIKMNKEEIQGKYKIVLRANDNNVNPQVRVQKAREILAAVSNPLALQSGLVTPMNIANAYKRFFQELDISNAEEFYSMPQPQQPGVPDKTLPKFEDLEEVEQAQILMRMGIKPDRLNRIAAKQREIRNESSDNLINVVNSMK